MDRFKFRAFDKKINTLFEDIGVWGRELFIQSADIPDDYLETFEITDVSVDNDLVEIRLTDRFTVEQCTGLKDKHGKLIYEGDKLFCEDILIYAECEGDEKFAVVEWDAGSGKFIADMRTTCYIMSACRFWTCEIIGNIHEGNQE